jgi:serine/threonine-protein kinase RsbW
MSTVREPRRVTYSLKNDTSELDRLRSFLRGALSGSAFSELDQRKIVMAVDEAVSNIIEHSFEEHAKSTIDLELEFSPERLTICIRDTGRSFDPDTVPDPNLEEHVKGRKRRGLGIFLMRRIMDEVHYNFKEGVRNELVLIKGIQEDR